MSDSRQWNIDGPPRFGEPFYSSILTKLGQKVTSFIFSEGFAKGGLALGSMSTAGYNAAADAVMSQPDQSPPEIVTPPHAYKKSRLARLGRGIRDFVQNLDSTPPTRTDPAAAEQQALQSMALSGAILTLKDDRAIAKVMEQWHAEVFDENGEIL